MNIRNRRFISGLLFVTLLLVLLLLANISGVRATVEEPTHHANLYGDACEVDNVTYLYYLAESWSPTGSQGLNDGVYLDYRTVKNGVYSDWEEIGTFAFTNTNGRKVEDTKPITGTFDKIDLRYFITQPWHNGFPGGQTDQKSFVPTQCPNEATPTATPTVKGQETEPSTPTVTNTPTPTHTPTPTVTHTPTNTPTVTPTATPTQATTNDQETPEGVLDKTFLPLLTR